MDALLSCGDVDLMEPSGKKLAAREECFVTPPESLSGMPLVYATYEGSGVVGSPTAGFAYFVEKNDTLVVISADRTRVRHISQEQIMQTVAMRVAQSLGASFLVHGTQVLCNIKGVSQTGETYGEAALRAILAFERAEQDGQASGGPLR
ncbi:hypothetical protein [Methyloversatilis universalis]|nr:hypothetical protein [Methyloversatilis universalis]